MKYQSLLSLLVAIAIGPIHLSCSSTQSENVKSSGIYVSYTIISETGNPSRARADATFFVGGPTGTVLSLNGDDSITCNSNALGKGSDLVGKIYYFGDCGTFSAGASYTFVLTRSDGSFSSSVTLPAGLQITSHSDNTQFGTRGSAISVQWDTSSSDSLSITLSGSGTSSANSSEQSSFSNSTSATDIGSATLPASWTNPTTISGTISNATITVSRSRSGTVASGLAGGTITASTGDTVSNGTIVP